MNGAYVMQNILDNPNWFYDFLRVPWQVYKHEDVIQSRPLLQTLKIVSCVILIEKNF